MKSSFGRAIAEARKKKHVSQRELATRIRREDGDFISGQYVNDLEHDRRNPPPEFVIRQFAAELDLDADHLCALAGRWPSELIEIAAARPDDFIEGFRLFRTSLARRRPK